VFCPSDYEDIGTEPISLENGLLAILLCRHLEKSLLQISDYVLTGHIFFRRRELPGLERFTWEDPTQFEKQGDHNNKRVSAKGRCLFSP